jgi:hypothetical protein
VCIIVEYCPDPPSLKVPMKNFRVLLLAGLVTALPLFAAEEKNPMPAAPAVQVVLKRANLPAGQTLDEVTTTAAVVDGDVEGKLAINVGTAEQPKFWTVRFDSEGDGWILITVSDTSRMREGVSEGTSWVAPVELFEVFIPFDGSGNVTIYKTKTESLSIELTPVANVAKEKPEAE